MKRRLLTVERGFLGAAILAFISASLAPVGGADAGPDLQDYRPDTVITGVLRTRGNDQMAGLLKVWEAGFAKYHPRLVFEDTMTGTGSAMYGLDMRTADLAAMGRPQNPYERYGTYERSWYYAQPIEVATGSDKTPRKSAAFAILVNKDNPLSKLTTKQLDGIFGARRVGAWNGLSWDEKAARPASDDIRTWGQLGLKGEWAKRPIHVYGPANEGPGAISPFEIMVFHGGAIWNEDLREYADPAKLAEDLSKDPDGITYAPLGDGNDRLKPVAIAAQDGGPYVPLTRETVADRSYPLTRAIYLLFTIDNEKSELANPRVAPRVREFLRYVLSRQGQADVVKQGDFLPLPPSVAADMLKKIDSKEEPPEHEVLEE